MKKFLSLSLLLLIFLPSVLAVGTTSAMTKVPFEPLANKTISCWIINSNEYDETYDVMVEGDFAQYVFVKTKKVEVPGMSVKKAEIEIRFPEKINLSKSSFIVGGYKCGSSVGCIGTGIPIQIVQPEEANFSFQENKFRNFMNGLRLWLSFGDENIAIVHASALAEIFRAEESNKIKGLIVLLDENDLRTDKFIDLVKNYDKPVIALIERDTLLAELIVIDSYTEGVVLSNNSEIDTGTILTTQQTWTPEKAKEIGLVLEVGDLEAAKQQIKEIVGLQKPHYLTLI